LPQPLPLHFSWLIIFKSSGHELRGWTEKRFTDGYQVHVCGDFEKLFFPFFFISAADPSTEILGYAPAMFVAIYLFYNPNYFT